MDMELEIILKQLLQTLFNIFAKNLASDQNSQINQTRKKRSSTSNPKKGPSARKIIKVTSC